MSVGLLALLDDVAMLMDDAAIATKVSMQKTAGILGDDLAVNAEKATGFSASRELPVLWKITKGAFLNKIIILPIAFLLSYFLPILILPFLLMGGIYLAFEGSEKVVEKIEEILFKKKHHTLEEKGISEEKKVKSAILTDFILSIEIIIIALSTVIEKSFMIQVIVVSIVALAAVIFVYGLVGLLIRLDDIGLYLIKRSNNKGILTWFGNILILSLPKIVRFLGFVGTLAMFLVAGGIFSHNINLIHHIYIDYFSSLNVLLFDLFLGFIIGLLVILFLNSFNFLKSRLIKKV